MNSGLLTGNTYTNPYSCAKRHCRYIEIMRLLISAASLSATKDYRPQKTRGKLLQTQYSQNERLQTLISPITRKTRHLKRKALKDDERTSKTYHEQGKRDDPLHLFKIRVRIFKTARIQKRVPGILRVGIPLKHRFFTG